MQMDPRYSPTLRNAVDDLIRARLTDTEAELLVATIALAFQEGIAAGIREITAALRTSVVRPG